ncbi:MAG: aminoacyl--tRNA ligase-related protein [Candidatus Uhrbacteria bacterium]
MRQSRLFTHTTKNAPHDADSVNSKFLSQGGFVHQEMAGVYSWLPLGLRVLRKVENIIRQELDAIGAQEILMSALQPKENWDTSGRWDSVDVLFKVPSQTGKVYGLGPTHEEIVTPLVKSFLSSYKELPVAVYQIQSKFRDELRAKSGVLRGREFGMKDLYSFHANTADLETYYRKVLETYLTIFSRCGLQAKVVEASGGSFTKKFSHEFQVLTPAGEDKILTSENGSFAQNSEITDLKEGDKNPENGETLEIKTGVEVGNIFDLGTKFSDAFDVAFTDENGERKTAIMGCYGIGTTRLVGTIVEASHDEKGIIWPIQVAPYHVYLASLHSKDESVRARIQSVAQETYDQLWAAGVEVLWDDREGISPGEKFADADIIGLPLRLVVSEKTLKEDAVEWKVRNEKEMQLVKIEDVVEKVKGMMK